MTMEVDSKEELPKPCSKFRDIKVSRSNILLYFITLYFIRNILRILVSVWDVLKTQKYLTTRLILQKAKPGSDSLGDGENIIQRVMLQVVILQDVHLDSDLH